MTKAINPPKRKKSSACKCDYCRLCRRTRSVITSRDPDKLIKLVNDLMNLHCNEGEDLSVYKAIMEGSWPSAVEQLTKALKKAKVFEKQRKIV